MAWTALLPVITSILGKVVDKALPDEEAKDKAKAALMQELLLSSKELELASAEIIKTEAASEHWLAANWRPIVMLTFTALIVARWLGWATPNLAPDEYKYLWSIVELGLGGYVIGRTGEKFIPVLAELAKAKGAK